MNRKHSGYSLAHDQVRGVWYVNSWSRVTEFMTHSEPATEDFTSYAEAELALRELTANV